MDAVDPNFLFLMKNLKKNMPFSFKDLNYISREGKPTHH